VNPLFEPSRDHTSTRSGRGFAALAALGLAAVFGPLARADAPMVLINRSLTERPVRLIGLDAQSIIIADATGRPLRLEPEGLLAIVAADPRPEPADLGAPETDAGSVDPEDVPVPGLPAESPSAADDDEVWAMTLTDGQRVLGRPLAVPRGDEAMLVFDTLRFGPVTVDLERIAALERSGWGPASADNAAVDADVVVLTNGDQLRGFVVAIADPVAIETEDGTFAEISLDRISGVTLANPTEPTAATRVTLRTGEVIAVRPAPSSPGTPRCLALLPALAHAGAHHAGDGPSRHASSSADDFLTRLCIDAAEVRSLTLPGERVIALAAIEPIGIVPGPGRRRTDGLTPEPAHLARLVPSIALPGPMRVEWTLPPDAGSLAFDARLGATTDAPSAPPGPWADAVLRVSVSTPAGAIILAEHRLDAGSPDARVAVSLPAIGERRTLTIQLDPGARGPVQDRVLLVRPMLVAPE
jgi:hypothetical protein